MTIARLTFSAPIPICGTWDRQADFRAPEWAIEQVDDGVWRLTRAGALPLVFYTDGHACWQVEEPKPAPQPAPPVAGLRNRRQRA